MDDRYRINFAKTELREAYEAGDVKLLLSVFHSSGFTDMSAGGPSKYGVEALSRLADDSAKLFAAYFVKFTPIVISIAVLGEVAMDHGWHEFTLAPKSGGAPIRKRQRYLDVWRRDSNGDWKISLHINNPDIPEEMQGLASTWFLSESSPAAEA
jgi:ketosteroid isomerase-like protein